MLNYGHAQFKSISVGGQRFAGGASGGIGMVQCASAVFDPSGVAAHRGTGAHGLGVTIPDNAVIVGGFVDVTETFQSTAGGTDKATIALHAESAGDLVAAVAIETGTPWDEGRQAMIPKFNTPETTSIKLSAAREITATVAIAALTAGKATINVFFVPGS